MSNPLIIEDHGNAVVIRFNRPEVRNPLSVAVLDLLDEAISAIGHNVEYTIFTGTKNIFASGADLREISQIRAAAAPAFARRGQHLMNKIAAMPQLTIAAINGPCYGGALDLVLACKRRIATKNASFCHPGTGLGIITGWGGTQRLPRLVGEANALEMFFTASPISAERANAIGLVDEIVESVEDRIKTFIDRGP